MGEKACILVVDDDENARKTLAAILKRKGYTVEVAQTGKAALELAQNRSLNLILLDIRLPDTNGTELVAPIKRLNPDIAIIMVTGFASVENSIQSMNAGASGYLKKPINTSEMLAKIHDLLERQDLIREKRQAEQALKESEERYRSIIELNNAGYFRIDADGLFWEVNQAWLTMHGYSSRDEIIGKHFTFTQVEKDINQAKSIVNQLLEGESIRTGEFTRLCKDGSTGYHTFTANPVMHKGKIVGLEGFLIDITEKKKDEEELRKSKEKLSTLFQVLPIGLSVMDENRAIILDNPALESIIGLSHEDILHKRYEKRRYLRSDGTSMPYREIPSNHALSYNRIIRDREVGILKEDGEIIWVSVNAVPLTFSDWRVLVTTKDITQQKHAEKALLESENRYRSFVEKFKGIAYQFTSHWIPIFLHGSVEEITGYSEQDFISGNPRWDQIMYPEDLEEIIKRDNEKLLTVPGHFIHREYRIIRKDGQVRWLSDLIQNSKTESGGFLLSGVLTDITKQKTAETALKESEERYRVLAETSSDVIFIHDPDGTFRYMNQTGAKNLCIYQEEIVGLSNRDLFPADIASRQQQLVSDVIASKKPVSIEMEIPIQGEPHWFDVHLMPLMREDRTVGSVMGSVRDITERKGLEDALLESEERYRILSDGSPMAICMIGRDNTVLYCNQFAAHLMDLTPTELIGKNRTDLFPREIAVQQELMFEEIFKTGITKRYEEKHVSYDGTEVWLDGIHTPIFNNNGEVYAIMSTSLDITDKKKTEKLLQESEKRFRMSIERAPEAILLYDVALNRYVEANARAEQLFGCNRQQLLDLGPQQFYKPDQPDNRPIDETLEEHRRLVLAGKTTIFERHIRNGRDEELVLEVRLVQLQFVDHILVRSSYIDITERKRAEEALSEVNRKLNLLNSITRHDILNQVSVLFGCIDLMKERVQDPLLVTYLENENVVANSILHQIEFTRDYQDMGVKAPAWQNVHDGINQATASLSMRNVTTQEDRTDLELLADPLFEKVFYNLIENALLHGGDQLRTIHIFSYETDDELVITCEDDGVGIKDDDKQFVFERGFGKHNGLGLFLTREILSITGITIRETSEPGKGARFQISVPKGKWRYT